MKLYHGDLNYAFPDNGILPDMIATMDIDEFSEDLDPDIEDLKLRQDHLRIDHRISDISVGPLPNEEEDQDIRTGQNWEIDQEEDMTWNFQPEGDLDRPESPLTVDHDPTRNPITTTMFPEDTCAPNITNSFGGAQGQGRDMGQSQFGGGQVLSRHIKVEPTFAPQNYGGQMLTNSETDYRYPENYRSRD